MQIIPKIRTKYGETIGVELFVQPPDLDEHKHTFINTDSALGASSYTVENGAKFSVSEYIVVGPWGAQKSEINRLHASSTPSSTTLTLSAVNTFAHNRGDRVTFIPYNQITIQRSTNAGVSYSDLVTVDIRPDSTETYYNHTSGAATDYYRAKFYNSGTASSSTVSAGIIATGFAENSAGNILRRALLDLGERIDGAVITKEFLLNALQEARQEIDTSELVERWSFRSVFDYDAGDCIPGQYQLTLPSNLRDPATYKNVLSVRIGKIKVPLEQTNRQDINGYYTGVARTTLNGAIETADTSIILTSSGDFEESGDVVIAAASVSETLDTVSYTGNTESTATLTGVTGIQAAGHTSATLVWQGVQFGIPVAYTVEGGTMTFSQPFSDDIAAQNIWLDYYKQLVRADDDGDVLDEPWAEAVYVPYMRYRIKAKRNPALDITTDPDYQVWAKRRDAQIAKEFSGNDMYLTPDVPNP
jgi:hypothetical protein